jgi:hypothetical protein
VMDLGGWLRVLVSPATIPSGLVHSAIPKLPKQFKLSSWEQELSSTSCRKIVVGLRRLSVTATRRRSMFGAPKSSLPPPTAAARTRSCGDPAKPNRWYGGGRRGSWRRALQV